jgi:hypothetical protein
MRISSGTSVTTAVRAHLAKAVAVVFRAGLCVLAFPAAAFAGTSESSDENLVIVGLAVFFALLLGLYLLTRRIKTIIRLKYSGAAVQDQPDQPLPPPDDTADHSALRTSAA